MPWDVVKPEGPSCPLCLSWVTVTKESCPVDKRRVSK